MKKMKVVLTTEGTYPYCTGGVSTWADILIKNLADIDFSILAIMMNPFQTMKFELPANVSQLINVPLWGTEEPAEYISNKSFAEIFINKTNPDDAIRDSFKDIMGMFICSIYTDNPDLKSIGNNLVALYDIFQEHDYRNIFRSQWLWDFFYQLFLQIHEKSSLFTVQEFENGYSLENLCQLIAKSYNGLHNKQENATIERLNEVLELPSFFDVWKAKNDDAVGDDIAALIVDTDNSRKAGFYHLPLLQQKKILKLNRLLIEKTFQSECPKYADKPGEMPSIYDCVESLRWIYRFLITLLAPLSAADVYHSTAAAFCGLPCIIAKLKFGSKFMLTEHGIYVREQYLYASREKMAPQSKRFLMGLIVMVSKLNYYFADQILPVCEYNKRWEINFGANEEKIHVIYNGIDTDRFRRIALDRDQRPTVVMIARIDQLKDIETYILTCNEVRKEIENVLFKLYGPEVDAEYFQKCRDLVSELQLQQNFVFSGLTSTPEISNNEGDIVLLTSISEAFPFSVIEGMACEKCIISSDVGGTSEVLEGYGFVVQPRNYMEFAEKVVYCLENPGMCAEMGIEARQRILGGFRTHDMVTNYRNSYLGMAGLPI